MNRDKIIELKECMKRIVFVVVCFVVVSVSCIETQAGVRIIEKKFHVEFEKYFTSCESGVIRVQHNGKWGFVDRNGDALTLCIYESVVPGGNGCG